MKVALAALQELAARHDSQLSKVRAQSVLKEQEHREMVDKLRFHDSQYSALQEQHVLLKRRQPGLSAAPHPMCYGIELRSEGIQSLNHMMVTDCVLCLKPFPIHDIVVASFATFTTLGALSATLGLTNHVRM